MARSKLGKQRYTFSAVQSLTDIYGRSLRRACDILTGTAKRGPKPEIFGQNVAGKLTAIFVLETTEHVKPSAIIARELRIHVNHAIHEIHLNFPVDDDEGAVKSYMPNMVHRRAHYDENLDYFTSMGVDMVEDMPWHGKAEWIDFNLAIAVQGASVEWLRTVGM